jgi:hypothetical protein
MVEEMLARMMDYEVSNQIRAERHERSGERQAYRNGYRERALHTRLGTLDVPIPKLRSGSYFPSFLEPRRLSEKAIAAVVQEAWIPGVSTRKVYDLKLPAARPVGGGIHYIYTESINNIAKGMNRIGRGYSFDVTRARLLFDDDTRKDTRTTIRKKTRKAVERPSIGFALGDLSMSRMMTSPTHFLDTYEDGTVEYGPYLPTLAKKLEAGDFA